MKRLLQNTSIKMDPFISYNNTRLTIESINSFDKTTKDKNDANNNLRENIIGSIINKQIPNRWYSSNPKWKSLKDELMLFVNNRYKNIQTIEVIHKGGRGFSYDFEFIVTHIPNKHDIKLKQHEKWEFKFNAETINDTPQFSSPMYPSKYFNMNYEEWFWENYLDKIAEKGGIDKPTKEIYLKQIHNNKPDCMELYSKLYDEGKPKKKISENGIEFYKFCKKIDKESISEFLSIATFDPTKLSDYFLEKQKDKHYLLYKNGKFYYDSLNENLFKIKPTSIMVKSPNIICETESGYKLEIKLRWKNGNGIAFPAFQVSRKLPIKTELITICQENNLPYSNKNKNELIKILDINNIIY